MAIYKQINVPFANPSKMKKKHTYQILSREEVWKENSDG